MYTMTDWERDGSLNISVGQEVSDAVVNELKNCMPPTWLGGGLFQVGEAEDQDAEHPAWPIYDTFKRTENGWVYLGTCLRGQTEPRKGFVKSLYGICR